MPLRLLAAWIFVASLQPLVAQDTWGGLRFGMTEEAAKLALKGQAKTTDYPRGTVLYTPLEIPAVVMGSATGQGTLRFDVRTQTLKEIELRFNRYSANASAPVSKEDFTARLDTYREVSSALLEKHGKPVSEAGYCPTVSELAEHYSRNPSGDASGSLFKCGRVWKEPGHEVEMQTIMLARSLFLWVRYRAMP